MQDSYPTHDERTPVYIIGTVHCDPDGSERLESLLYRLKPDVVGIEYHEGREELVRQAIERNEKDLELAREAHKVLAAYLKEYEEQHEGQCGSGMDASPGEHAAYLERKEAFGIIDTALRLEPLINGVIGYEIRAIERYLKQFPKAKRYEIDLPVFETVEEIDQLTSDLYPFDDKDTLLDLHHECMTDAELADWFKRLYAEYSDGFYDEGPEELDKYLRGSPKNDLDRRVIDSDRDLHMAGMLEGIIGSNRGRTHLYVVGLGHLHAISDALRTLALPYADLHIMSLRDADELYM